MYFGVVALLCLFPVGRSAPLTSSSCEDLLKPIEKNSTEMLGKWSYIGSSSDLPGSQLPIGHLMTSAWVDYTPTTQENTLNIMQAQRACGNCSSYNYSVTFENSAILIEEPFYMKEVLLRTDCPDCLVIHEVLTSGADTFTTVMLYSKRKSVSPAVVQMFQKQVECFKMPPPIMIDTNYENSEICPDPTSPMQGLDDIHSLLESARLLLRIVRLLGEFERFTNVLQNSTTLELCHMYSSIE